VPSREFPFSLFVDLTWQRQQRALLSGLRRVGPPSTPTLPVGLHFLVLPLPRVRVLVYQIRFAVWGPQEGVLGWGLEARMLPRSWQLCGVSRCGACVCLFLHARARAHACGWRVV